MSNKNIIIAVIIAVVVSCGGFYGGMLYGKSQSKQSIANQFGSGQRQNGQGTARRSATGAGFVSGQVIAKDDKSITVKSADGGSKIIFFSDTTQISKSATGTIEDLVKDSQVVVNGSTNPDGSITAELLQIRPQGSEGQPGFGRPQDSAPEQK